MSSVSLCIMEQSEVEHFAFILETMTRLGFGHIEHLHILLVQGVVPCGVDARKVTSKNQERIDSLSRFLFAIKKSLGHTVQQSYESKDIHPEVSWLSTLYAWVHCDALGRYPIPFLDHCFDYGSWSDQRQCSIQLSVDQARVLLKYLKWYESLACGRWSIMPEMIRSAVIRFSFVCVDRQSDLFREILYYCDKMHTILHVMMQESTSIVRQPHPSLVLAQKQIAWIDRVLNTNNTTGELLGPKGTELPALFRTLSFLTDQP